MTLVKHWPFGETVGIYLAHDVEKVVAEKDEQWTKTNAEYERVSRALSMCQAELAHVQAELSAETAKRIELVGQVFDLEKDCEGLKQRLSRYEANMIWTRTKPTVMNKWYWYRDNYFTARPVLVEKFNGDGESPRASGRDLTDYVSRLGGEWSSEPIKQPKEAT